MKVTLILYNTYQEVKPTGKWQLIDNDGDLTLFLEVSYERYIDAWDKKSIPRKFLGITIGAKTILWLHKEIKVVVDYVSENNLSLIIEHDIMECENESTTN